MIMSAEEIQRGRFAHLGADRSHDIITSLAMLRYFPGVVLA